MKSTSVVELKAHLSRFLRLAQEGHTIEVLSHRQAVARIVPATQPPESLVVPPDRPVSELEGLKGVRISSGADPVAALLRDRSRR
jgi:antitoxin (DNA-binding transcriptional repressor) of toxin-antitoxin stability system